VTKEELMKRLLVGTDGSVSGQAAVSWAVDIARTTDSELVVARAWRPGFAEVAPETYDELRDDARGTLDDHWCAVARESDTPYQPLLLEGDPREVLLAAAADTHADLVVVGARGTGSHPHALHLGSVTHHLVHNTTLPLAAIPASARSVWPTPILVGVNGSPGSANAVAWCRDVAPRLGAEVIAVYAELPLAEWVPHTDPTSWYQTALKDCEEWASPLRDAGIPTRSVVIEHEPVTALTEAGIRERAGLIVVGTRGTGGFPGLHLGSTALKVLHHSGLPVVLVPPTP
jgi:nucleotide-binding universal stress UspA family protein